MTKKNLVVLLVLVSAHTTSLHKLSAEAVRSPNASLEVQVPVPPTTVSIDGRNCLAYELHITNFRGASLSLMRIDAIDATNARLVRSYEGPALASALGRPARAGSSLSDARVISSGERVVFFAWLEFDREADLPMQLRHRISFQFGANESGVVQIAPVTVRKEEPLVLSPPLRGGPWVALYDPSLNGGHRRALFAIDGKAHIPARFAIDWIKVDSKGAAGRGDSSIIANSYSYGADVLAVANGRVAVVEDGLPEPTPKGSFESDAGNYVALDLGGGRYAFYEHLRPGSLRVKVGEQVKSGQVLGSVGGSGSVSSGAHLHFHVADADSSLSAEGVPFVFDDFEELGFFDSIETAGTGKPWLPLHGERTTRQTMVMPGMLAVVRFNDGGN